MATPVSLRDVNPQNISISILIGSIILFAMMVATIIGITNHQNQKLLEYELLTILRGNGSTLREGSSREFAQKLPAGDREYFLKIININDSNKFEAGVESIEKDGVCVRDSYFEFELEYCRPTPIPWNSLKIAVSIFLIIVFGLIVLLRKITTNLLFSFKRLFRLAEIPYPPNLNFGLAWRIAAEMAERFQAFQKRTLDLEKNRAIVSIAREVAHDIRSPLSTLNLATHGLNDIAEDRRNLISDSIRRINDIANDLLRMSKATALSGHIFPEYSDRSRFTEIVVIKSELQRIVSEKRTQFRQLPNIVIESDFTNFSTEAIIVNRTDLSRVISNLINNAVESLNNESGKIKIRLEKFSKELVIFIEDNGRGIPNRILSQLGKEGVSFGKQDESLGNGIGLFHAKRAIESWKGTLKISSIENFGTSVEICLPIASELT